MTAMVDEWVYGFVMSEAQAQGYPGVEVVITPELERVVGEYSEQLSTALFEFVKQETGWDEDRVWDFVQTLEEEGNASLYVLLTLQGAGAGIWDGRWEPYMKEDQIARLQRFLKARLGAYADDTGAGDLNMAIETAALESAGVVEPSNGGNGGGGGNGARPMFAMPRFTPNVWQHWEGEQLAGGLSSGWRPEEFDPDQLQLGIESEMEHTDDPGIAQEIAMDHLVEDERYYDKLAAAGL